MGETVVARELLDHWMRPHIESLNSIPGVTTLQSCAGHEDGERRRASSETHACDGHMWFVATALFTDKRLSGLAEDQSLESVSKLYGREAFPVVEVTFSRESRDLAMQRVHLYLSKWTRDDMDR